MNTNVNKGMQAMQARLASMTPEERKAASAKAAAASAAAAKARAEQRRATSAAGAVATADRGATVEARVTPPAPEVMRSWDVCLLEGEDTLIWARVDAPGMKRAGRAAAKAHPGAKVQGCVLAGVLKLG